MLKQRVITALLLLPPVLAAVWFLPTVWIVVLFGAASLLAAQEWALLAACNTRVRQAGFVAGTAAIIALLWLDRSLVRDAALVLALLWWIWMVRWVTIYPRNFGPGDPPVWLRIAAGLLVIPAAVLALAVLHGGEHGPLRVLFLLFLVWAADVGAYFAGRVLGRHKLVPQVSPGKTWEGVAGGLGLAAVIVWIGGMWVFEAQGLQWLGLFAVGFVVVALSIVGDLTESLLKRQAGVKDSGSLLPGHGGMLDRADSLLAAAPALALGLRWVGL